jgi:hypothetical protein
VKAGAFSGSQSHRGKSQSPVAWIAARRETNELKPIDKAILGMVSESPGRNASEPTGGPEMKRSRRPSPLLVDEGSRLRRNLTDAVELSGGVVGTAR